MNKRVNIILGLVFGGLLVVATQPYWSEYLELDQFKSTQKTEKLSTPSNPTTVSLQSSPEADPVVISTIDGVWQVNGFVADIRQVNELLQDLDGLAIESVVSTNPNNFYVYEATESAAKVRIENSSGDSQELLVGKNAAQFGSVYLRQAQEEEVYLVKSRLRSYVFKVDQDWRDKTILALSPDEVEAINLTQKGETIILSANEEAVWSARSQTEERIIGDVAKERLFDSLADLQGTGFADEDQTRVYQQRLNALTMNIEFKDDREAIELVFVEDVNNSVWLVVSPQTEDVLTLSPIEVNLLIDSSFTLFN